MDQHDPMHLLHAEQLLKHIGDEIIAHFLAASASHFGLHPDEVSYEKLSHSYQSSSVKQLHNPAGDKS
jgi:hypothetical protein